MRSRLHTQCSPFVIADHVDGEVHKSGISAHDLSLKVNIKRMIVVIDSLIHFVPCYSIFEITGGC